ncbi:MAG: helix-turn-helix domain-containing protein [Rhizomicrobium sp.]|jgi:AraC-like DNA-binding protein
MRQLTRTAPPPLDRDIELVWYWEGAPTAHARDAIMASASMGLLINLAGDSLRWYGGEGFSASNCMRGIGIAGPSSRTFAIDAYQPKMMGVHFRAGGAYPFFGPAIGACTDCHVSLDDVWGAEAGRLHQRLVEAPTPLRKLDILLRALLDRAQSAVEHHPAVRQALHCLSHAPRSARISAVATEIGLSQKRLIRLFSAQVGLRPKLYLRITRFQRVLRQIARAPDVDWGDIVERNGYYDQSHFIRDFGEFSALSPGVYLKRRGPHLQHVPLPA